MGHRAIQAEVFGQHPGHRRLLQHDLADQDRPGCRAGRAPGQVPRVARIPGQHRLGVGRRHDAAYRGTGRRGRPNAANSQVTSVPRPAGLRAWVSNSLHTLRMDRNAYRDDNDTDQPDAYWRRRVIALCAGLTLLGVLAWAFSAAGSRPARRRRAPRRTASCPPLPTAAPRRHHPPELTRPHPLRPARWPACLSPRSPRPPGPASPGTAVPGRQGRSARRGDRPADRGRRRRTATPGPASGVEPGGGCAPGAVVLSLFPSGTSYHAGQYPAFEVYAVSTASRACSFDVSPTKLHVLVMSSGRVIWDSADCTRGQPNRVAELRRGVPAPGVGQLEPHDQPAGLRHAGVVGASRHLPGAGQGRHRGQPHPYLQARPLARRPRRLAGRPARDRSPERRRAPGGCPPPPAPA